MMMIHCHLAKRKKHQKNFFCQQFEEVCVEQVVRAAGVQSPAPKLMAAASKEGHTCVHKRTHQRCTGQCGDTRHIYESLCFPTFGSYQKMKPHTFVFESNWIEIHLHGDLVECTLYESAGQNWGRKQVALIWPIGFNSFGMQRFSPIWCRAKQSNEIWGEKNISQPW